MDFSPLAASLKGEFYDSNLWKKLYATDASVYRELPAGVAFPKDQDDIIQLVKFAGQNDLSLIPRSAGTSLAGQCVGDGIVVDVSKHMHSILEVNAKERWARVQPGVIRDELNFHLRPEGLLFGPNTSTSNRAMIGGMVGNNSCGSYSIVFGSTRDHILELSCVLSDGSTAVFKSCSREELEANAKLDSLEGKVYKQILSCLDDPKNQQSIEKGFPKKGVHRRNNGYSLDVLLETAAFGDHEKPFNLATLICGSEGTLAMITEIKVNLEPVPPPKKALVCGHFDTVVDSLRGTQVAMKHKLQACELMDRLVLDCTRDSIEFSKYRFFVEGDPGAIIIAEIAEETEEALSKSVEALRADWGDQGLCYASPVVHEPDLDKVWKLRAAGLGLLSNVPGDKKPVAVVEDTAVSLEDLPAYIDEFGKMMDGFGQKAVYYAHAGAGELHLRPILDLKEEGDLKQFREIGLASAELVKKYDGSLAGEHGLGRVRAEFVPLVMGEEVYELFKEIKSTWDPQNLFNPGKLVEAEPMDVKLRYNAPQETRSFDTKMSYREEGGILRMAEKCNGSGDCRKLHLLGGTMCPSYMATRDEGATTRGRANMLREVLTNSEKANAFDSDELKEVMDLCLSCKGCTSECPSGVDMASMKAEWQYQYYKTHGIPFRAKMFGKIAESNSVASKVPFAYNMMVTNPLTASIGKWMLGVAQKRSLPTVGKQTVRKWHQKNWDSIRPEGAKKKVYFFSDEFTNYNDTFEGITSLKLLASLGYDVEIPKHEASGRSLISKGMLDEAAKIAEANVRLFSAIISESRPLIGIEPSAILSFRDEYKRLIPDDLRADLDRIQDHILTLEEFLVREIEEGNVSSGSFKDEERKLHLHGHCHQKSLSNLKLSEKLLSLPKNYEVETIPSGCCGMAGSFGYEADHYEVSMKIGELVLFPAVRKAPGRDIIVAAGTSCRHQIKDGTSRVAKHPAVILYEALKEPLG